MIIMIMIIRDYNPTQMMDGDSTGDNRGKLRFSIGKSYIKRCLNGDVPKKNRGC